MGYAAFKTSIQGTLIRGLPLALLLACQDHVSLTVVERVLPSGEGKALQYEPGSKVKRSDSDSRKTHPLIMADAGLVCNDITFYSAQGEMVQGTRLCKPSTPDPDLKPENIRTGESIHGITGTVMGVLDTPEIIPENILSGVNVGGVSGTMTAPPPDCLTEGEVGCVINGGFKAALTTDLANKVISGQTVAGIMGHVTLPAASKVVSAETFGLNSNLTGTLILPSASNVLIGSGTYGDPNQAIVPSYSPDFPNPANVRAQDTVNGVSGSLADCAQDGVTGCVANADYKAVDMSKATAGNIRSGVTIAGQLGAYPSSTYPLPSASDTVDLKSSNFNDLIHSSSSFEYWSSDGSYQVANGDADLKAAHVKVNVNIFGIDGLAPAELCSFTTKTLCEADKACRWSGSACELNPWNIRHGITIAKKVGTIKTNCRNRANSTLFDSDSMPPGTAATVAGSTIHWWDTINSFNADLHTLPMELPSGWTADHVCGKELWSDVTGDGACDSAEDDCMMRDNVSGQIWTESYPVTETAPAETALSWSQAVAHCNSLTYGERSDWRLPTLMELASLHHHGIREIGYKGGGAIRPGGDSLDNNDFFIPNVDISAWTATSRNTATALGELVQLGEGRLTALDKAANTASFLCTAP